MTSYTLPLPSSSQIPRKGSRKRKRKPEIEDVEAPLADDTTITGVENTEYSAVVTPEERVQRRLAGHPLNEHIPPLPFPHAPLPEPAPRTEPTDGVNVPDITSLRSQHLSAMTTLLHKCLQAKDYKRASRALGLIMRTEIHGKFVDLRHAGLWGIGAEILLCNPGTGRIGSISREGFERAKVFYDKMALQHPWHRTWPNVTNAQDFKLAMFGLWIYVTCLESKRMQLARDESGLENGGNGSDRELQSKRYELAEAERISQEMDTLMSTIPFIDDLELIRLRAQVATWTADLLERVDELEAELESNQSMQDQQMEQAWLGNTGIEEISNLSLSNVKASNARKLADNMMAKLRGNRVEGDLYRDEDTSESNIMSD